MPDTIGVLDKDGAAVTVKTNDALHTQLVAILAKLSADPATQTTLAAILSGMAALATSAKQDAAAALLALIGTRTYGTTTRVAATSTSAQSGAITATEVMIHASTRCFIKAGSNPTAVPDGDSIPLEAGEKFHKRITSGHKIAVIRDTADGYIHITPVA